MPSERVSPNADYGAGLFAELSPPYATIVADPPWPYDTADRQGREMPYSSMSVDDIAALPVIELSQPGSHIYLWVTNRYLFESRDVLLGWGFNPSTILVWAKRPAGFKPLGRFSCTTEFVVHGTRPVHGKARAVERAGAMIRAAREAKGLSRADLHRATRGGRPTGIVFRWEADEALPNERDWLRLQEVLPDLYCVQRPTVDAPPPREATTPDDRVNTTWWEWPVGSHSIKPAGFLDVVESVSPRPYVELFARQPRLGWDAWGYGDERVGVSPNDGLFDADCDCPRGPSSHPHAVHATNCATKRRLSPNDGSRP